jgi:GNAT superfamily N-acetyltransferase
MNAQTPIGPFVRPAIPDDAEGIAKVHVQSWQESYVGLLPQEVLDRQSVTARYRNWSSHLSRPGEHRWIFVAIDPAQGIVGFAEAIRAKRGLYAQAFDIPVIYILQSHLRRGLGRRLFHALSGPLLQQGPGEIGLWSLADNSTARAFYAAMGGKLTRARAEPERGGRTFLAGYRWKSAAELAERTAPLK